MVRYRAKIIDDPRCSTVNIDLPVQPKNGCMVGVLVNDILTCNKIVGSRECRPHIVITPPASALQGPQSEMHILYAIVSDHEGLNSCVSV